MSLDPYTIIAYTAGVLALISILFLVFWTKEGRDGRLLWFIFPLCMGTSGAILLAVPTALPGRLCLFLGTWLILLAYGLGWQAMRALYAQPPVLLRDIIPPTLWLCLAFVVFHPYHLANLNAFVRSLIVACFLGLAAYELSKKRDEKLPARAALFWTFAGYTFYTAVRIPFVGLLPAPIGGLPTKTWTVVVYNTTTVALVILVGSFMIALSRERVALKHYRMAMLDPLTGVRNRRAFSQAEADLSSSGEAARVVLMLIDIDHFKSVNDRFGHDVGDDVIKIAAQTAEETVKSTGKVFRMGGEEFACLFSFLELHEAYSIAERIRTTFKKSASDVSGHPINATISTGIATTLRGQKTLQAVLIKADEALYQAKRSGRDQSIVANMFDVEAEGSLVSAPNPMSLLSYRPSENLD